MSQQDKETLQTHGETLPDSEMNILEDQPELIKTKKLKEPMQVELKTLGGKSEKNLEKKSLKSQKRKNNRKSRKKTASISESSSTDTEESSGSDSSESPRPKKKRTKRNKKSRKSKKKTSKKRRHSSSSSSNSSSNSDTTNSSDSDSNSDSLSSSSSSSSQADSSSSSSSQSSTNINYDLFNNDTIRQLYFAYIKPCLIVTVEVVLLFIANLLFENSLSACDYDVIVCIKWLKSKMIGIIVQIFAFSLIHFTIVVLSIYIELCYVRWTGIILSMVSYGYRFQTSKGFGNLDHSKANMMISEMVLIFMTLVWIFWMITFKLWFLNRRRRRKGYKRAQRLPGGPRGQRPSLSKVEKFKKFVIDKKWFLVWMGAWFSFWFSVYWIRIANSCREINMGLASLNGYSDKGGECVWERGSVCWHYTIEGIFRPLFWGREKCSDFKDDLSFHEEM